METVLLQPCWENLLRIVLHSPWAGSNKYGFPSMQQFESHRRNMWEWGGNQPVLQVAKKAWCVIIELCQVLRHSFLLLQTQGIAQVLLTVRNLQPPCPPPACQLLFFRIVPLSLTAATEAAQDVPLWLRVWSHQGVCLRITVSQDEHTYSSGNYFPEHPDGWEEKLAGKGYRKCSPGKEQKYLRVRKSKCTEKDNNLKNPTNQPKNPHNKTTSQNHNSKTTKNLSQPLAPKIPKI